MISDRICRREYLSRPSHFIFPPLARHAYLALPSTAGSFRARFLRACGSVRLLETPRPTNRSPPLTAAFLYSPPLSPTSQRRKLIGASLRTRGTRMMGRDSPLRAVTEPEILPPTHEIRECSNARADGLPREVVMHVTRRRSKNARRASAMASPRIRDYSGIGFAFHERCEDTMEAHRGLGTITCASAAGASP